MVECSWLMAHGAQGPGVCPQVHAGSLVGSRPRGRTGSPSPYACLQFLLIIVVDPLIVISERVKIKDQNAEDSKFASSKAAKNANVHPLTSYKAEQFNSSYVHQVPN